MYIPDLSPGVKIPGLPTVAQERLRELVEKLVDARPQFPQWLNTRKDRELNAIQRLKVAVHNLEQNHLRNLACAGAQEQFNKAARQTAYRCQFVAEVLELRQMSLVRIQHAKALAQELVIMKQSVSTLPNDSPLSALYVNLSVLVSRFGRGHPDEALQYLHRVAELPEQYALRAVQTKFEEIAANPVVEGRDFVTLGILVPFIENHDASGVERQLLERVRDAKRARFACLDLKMGLDDLLRTRARIGAELEKAVREKDTKGIDRSTQEFYETEIGYAARGVDMMMLTDNLQRAQSQLTDALAAACRVIKIGFGLWSAESDGVEFLTSIINCISAHALLQEIAHDLPIFAEKVRSFGRPPRDMRNIAGEMLDRVLASPAVP